METNPLHPTVIPLLCPVTQHDWGTPGATSFSARLYTMNNHTYLSPSQPYSEFIVSSHPPHDALIATSPDETLRTHIQSQVIEVDPSIVQFYSQLHEDGVPFIIKIVSSVTPTGVRVHPDDAALSRSSIMSETTFDRPFSKPKMLVSLQKTHILVGFHSAKKIVAQLSRVPEFADVIGRARVDQFVHIVKSEIPTEQHVKNIVSTLLSKSSDTVSNCLTQAVNRLAKMPEDVVTDDDRLLIALANIFPDDPMCFGAYLFQRLEMNPGDAVFIPPTQPYCVLNGVFVEASSKSDAIFYAGLTAKDEIRSSQFLQTVSFDDSVSEVCIHIFDHYHNLSIYIYIYQHLFHHSKHNFLIDYDILI